LIFLYYFNILMLKIIFLKKYIILICFRMKSTLKNKRYHTSKHTFSITQNKVENFFHFSDLGSGVHLNRNLHLERISKT
jgi:hypothetical protein